MRNDEEIEKMFDMLWILILVTMIFSALVMIGLGMILYYVI